MGRNDTLSIYYTEFRREFENCGGGRREAFVVPQVDVLSTSCKHNTVLSLLVPRVGERGTLRDREPERKALGIIRTFQSKHLAFNKTLRELPPLLTFGLALASCLRTSNSCSASHRQVSPGASICISAVCPAHLEAARAATRQFAICERASSTHTKAEAGANVRD